MYNNLRHLPKRLSYLQYLDILLAAQNGPVHRDLPQETRMTKEFEKCVQLMLSGWIWCSDNISISYLTILHSYLLSFTKRTQPLIDIARIHQDAEAEFDDLWDKGKVDDWDPVKRENGEGTAGIWCIACQKQYSKQTVYDAHLKSKRHTKAIEREAADGATASPADPNGAAAPKGTNGLVSDMRSKYRTAANLTHLITTLLQSLSTTLADTKSNVERRFSLTARERELELEEAAKPPSAPAANGNHTAAQEDEEEEEKIYNPLKLPLGWDGKPIPYWLYKLHGLGVEYRCEICSDHVYMGRKNFDRHFQVCFESLYTRSKSTNLLATMDNRSRDMPSVCVRWVYQTRNIFMRSHVSKTHYHVCIYIVLLSFSPFTHFRYPCSGREAQTRRAPGNFPAGDHGRTRG
jgi:splicing factor 3A subunit 3